MEYTYNKTLQIIKAKVSVRSFIYDMLGFEVDEDNIVITDLDIVGEQDILVTCNFTIYDRPDASYHINFIEDSIVIRNAHTMSQQVYISR